MVTALKSRFRLRAVVSRAGPLAALAPFAAAGLGWPVDPSMGQAGQRGSYASAALPILKKFCWTCHTGETAPAGLKLDRFRTEADLLANRAAIERVVQRLKSRTMPPPGVAQPSQAERDRMVQAIQASFAKATPPVSDPGRPTMRRLNRSEYDNTIRDLFGIDFDAAADFPSDDVGYGFDNIGDVLSISPLLMEKYLDAAEEIAAKVIQLPALRTRAFDASDLETDTGRLGNENAVALFTNGRAWIDSDIERPGLYRIRVTAWSTPAGSEEAKMALRVDGKELEVFEVRARAGRPATYEIPPMQLEPGKRRFAAAFINDFYDPNNENPRRRDRNLFVQSIEVSGPLNAISSVPEPHRRIMIATPDPADPMPAARTILSAYLKRAFRRPVSAEEVDRYRNFVAIARKEGRSFEEGVRLAIQASLVSPHFLFRVELDAPHGRPPVGRTRPVNGFELASRLSYFLWSSMPDGRLFSLAESGELAKPSVLRTEVERMLRDPKSRALTTDFAAQWLTLRKLSASAPDPELFPDWSEELRSAMKRETELFFQYVVDEDRPVTEFLSADYTFVDETLAKHYGLNPPGRGFRRVTFPDKRRGGLLGMGSILTLTSNPNRTSPVKRGKWVLETLLGSPPPPPPPGLDTLSEDESKAPTRTIKERMAAHRSKPECAVCHAKMDPLGFAFENFDAVGRWRNRDGSFPVDAADVLPDGTRLNGPATLRALLMKRKSEFVRTLAEKLLTFAIGRGLTPEDDDDVNKIANACAREGYKFSALVRAVAASEPFTMRSAPR